MPPTATGGRPNVVLLTAHDLGQHLGCYGVDAVDTPNLDGLAGDGVRFANATATTPVCSPSRGSLLTGRYPQSNGLLGLTHSPWWWRLDDGERTLPELLADAGYGTHLAGIQHVAPEADRLGYDHVHTTAHDAGDVTSAAAAAVRDAEAPFYAQVGFFETHRPFEHGTHDPDDVFVPPYLADTPEMRADLARFQAAVEHLDDRVGDVLDALKSSGRREETVVLFTADHGIPYPGAKWWCRSPGVEVALLADGPGPAFDERDVVEGVASNVDVVPTLLDVLGVPVPDRVEGVSFRDYLVGDADAPPRDVAFTQFTAAGNEARGAVTADHTLIRNFGAGRTIEYPVDADPATREGPNTGEPRPYAQLYDREADPYDLDDVAGDRPDVVADLSAQVRSWMASVDDPLLRGGVRYPYQERAVEDLLVGDDGTSALR